ncbi:hypothetical protein ACQUW5_06040 [Legionella sp. CNM-1927-20]|uniref:hypothetical protein n=1 Tax=Legionella sp. CNM-1927-20 TaxID=3422221 RepID=UPI00403ABBC1
MKILFEVLRGEKDKELREFEVEEGLFEQIKKITTANGSPADAEIHRKDRWHIVLNGQHYELNPKNFKGFDPYEEITKLLKRQSKKTLQKDEKAKENDRAGQSEYPIVFSEAEVEHIPIIQISLDAKKASETPGTAAYIIKNFLEKPYPQFAALSKLARNYIHLKGVDALRGFPAKLKVFNLAVFTKAVTALVPKLDFSFCQGSADEQHEKLLKKIKEIEKQQKYVAEILSFIGTAKYMYDDLASNYRFKHDLLGRLGQKPAEFEEDFQKIVGALNNFKVILEAQIDEIQSKLEKIEEERKEEELENSIIVRTWYASANDDEGGHEILGIPTDGHTTVELYKNKDERIYLGFYVRPRTERTTVDNIFKAVKLPTPNVGQGYFVDLAYDQSLVGKTKNHKFRRCETVVIKCNFEDGLDFDAAYKWAEEIKKKYTKIVTSESGTQIQVIIDDYQFYSNNCASFGAGALKQAKADDILRYFGKTIFNIDTPTGVREYAERLAALLARKRLELEEKKIIAGSEPIKKKYSRYIQLANEKLKLINTIDEQLQPALESLINQLSGVAADVSRLSEEEVDDYVQRLSIDLHLIVNQLLQKNDIACAEVVDVLKHLMELMPVQEKILIKVISTFIQINLSPYNAAFAKKNQPGVFNKIYISMAGEVYRIVHSEKNLFDKTIEIRTALLQLNKSYAKAIKLYRKEREKYNEGDQKLKNLEADFDELKKYYRAAQKQLVNALGELRCELYFRPGIGKTNRHLSILQELFLLDKKVTLDYQLSFPILIQNAKNQLMWAHDEALEHLKDDDKSMILMKASDPTVTAPKPNILAFWNWPKRHQHFEFENKAKIYQIVNNDQLSWKAKLQRINDLVSDHKPSVLKFWRRDERQRYDSMRAQASFICLLEAFAEGKLSEAYFVVEIEKIIPAMEKSRRSLLEQFKNDFLVAYQGLVAKEKTDNPNSKAQKPYTYKDMLGELLKTTASTSLHGDMFEDLGTALYAGHHYGRLNPVPKPKVSQPPELPTPEEQVAIEVGLWRHMS